MASTYNAFPSLEENVNQTWQNNFFAQIGLVYTYNLFHRFLSISAYFKYSGVPTARQYNRREKPRHSLQSGDTA